MDFTFQIRVSQKGPLISIQWKQFGCSWVIIRQEVLYLDHIWYLFQFLYTQIHTHCTYIAEKTENFVQIIKSNEM